jgi:hypothetical protein
MTKSIKKKVAKVVKKSSKKVAKKVLTKKVLIKKVAKKPVKASPTIKKVAKKPVKKASMKKALKKVSPAIKKVAKKAKLDGLFDEPVAVQPIQERPVDPYAGYQKVSLKCKRGSDASTKGQSCKSMRAYKLSKDGSNIAQFRCVACGHTWSVQVGGHISL